VAQPKARSGVLQTKNTNPNQQQDSTTMNMNITKQLKTKIVALKAIGQRKEYIFLAFFMELGIMAKTNYKDTIIPHGQLEI
jgi:hypothetical protein